MSVVVLLTIHVMYLQLYYVKAKFESIKTQLVISGLFEGKFVLYAGKTAVFFRHRVVIQ